MKKRPSGRFLTILACLGSLSHPPGAHATDGPCPFDNQSLQFTGTEVEQAKCLLRSVGPFGRLGSRLTELPPPLGDLIGKPVTISKEAFRQLLRERRIAETDLGGSLDEPLSRAKDGDQSAPAASYFVIHDTSAPNFGRNSFPDNINQQDWLFNDFARYSAVAHVFVNRLGASSTKVGFEIPFRATKFELQTLGIKGKGLFLHTELIQPRHSSPVGDPNNDALAPDPGFTEAQLDRLALIYVAASLRGGRWLVPAYHAVLDAGLPNGHDDPQSFDLALWAAKLRATLESIK